MDEAARRRQIAENRALLWDNNPSEANVQKHLQLMDEEDRKNQRHGRIAMLAWAVAMVVLIVQVVILLFRN